MRKRAFEARGFQARGRSSVHLNAELGEKYGRRSFPVRKGDTVKITRGDFKGVEGKVQKVFPAQGKVQVEGVTRAKVGGGTVQLQVPASKVMITAFALEDKARKSKLESKGGQ